MKFFFIKLTLFIFIIASIVGTYIIFSKQIIEKQVANSTEFQIDKSFLNAKSRKYTLIIMGNSRIYRGINPDKLNISSYGFAHDNDSYNQIYYKMLFLEKEKKIIRYMILGVDYFSFSIFSDTRNYAYKKYLSKEYIADYPVSKEIKKNTTNFIQVKISRTFPVFVKALFRFFIKREGPVMFIKDNGQYIVTFDELTKNDFIKRNSAILPIQKQYFEKIIKKCKEKNIILFLVMPPTRSNELQSYSQKTIEKFDHYFSSYQSKKVFYLNYSLDTSFSLNDYIDITHLNVKAADRFSIKLNQDILKKIKQIE